MRVKTTLLDVQKPGVEKLLHLKVGALYCDPGVGKTRMALGLAQPRLEAGKVSHILWLCPTSDIVKNNLRKEFTKHTEGWESVITLCGIETLSTSKKWKRKLLNLVMTKACFLVVDESLLVKNPYALRSKAIMRIAQFCTYKLLLNGTPLSRNEADLFSQWYILDWRILGYKSYWSFEANHLEYDEKYTKKIRRVLNVEYLTDKIAPYTVQLSKDGTMGIPHKAYSTYFFSLTEAQEEEYARVAEDFLSYERLQDNPDSPIIFRALSALQEVTAGHFIATPANRAIRHYPLFSNPNDNPRIKCLLRVLDTVIPDGEKVVIWCKYTHEITDIATVLKERNESFVLCHGKIKGKRRAAAQERFEKECRFFVANKACAGFSLNLQFAHYAIFYDNDWDWATREQAEDRMHRHGQKHVLQIIDICAESRIDERILTCSNRKGNLVEDFKEHVREKSLMSWVMGENDHYDSHRDG